jgi:hypothetical protein
MIVWTILAFALMGTAKAGENDRKPAFTLVGVYDASAVMGVSNKIQSDYLWRPSQNMEKSCGPSKSPDAMGMFEAEVVANQMSPALAIVLEHNADTTYVDQLGEECDPKTQQPCDPVPRPSVVPERDVTIGIGVEKSVYQLQPMVRPRNLAITVDGYVESEAEGEAPSSGLFDTSRYQKLIRTQLEIELCMEHKVGRGWLGNDKNRLRQAFLLDPPDNDRTDRKYFSGQRDPIPGLIGPPESCIVSSVELPKDSQASKGETSMNMTPSDIWGATLRECDKSMDVEGRPLLAPAKAISLGLTENGVRQARKLPPKWSGLNLQIEALGNDEKDVFITAVYNGEVLEALDNVRLFPEPGAMIDLLAHIPHSYPAIGTKDDPDRFVTLLVPNWQLSEGIRRLFSRSCVDDSGDKFCRCEIRSFSAPLGSGETLDEKLDDMDARLKCIDLDGELCSLSRDVREGAETSPAEMCSEKLDIDNPMSSGGLGVFDGVGWILEHPKFLYVQVQTLPDPTEGFQIMDYVPSFSSEEEKDVGAETSGSQLPNLADATSGGFMGMQDWGYSVGQLAGRAPIVLPFKERAAWDVAASAQRSLQHSYFIVSFFILAGFLLIGVRRWPDFWMRTPEERAFYWPGRQSKQEDPEPEGVELEGQGGEE